MKFTVDKFRRLTSIWAPIVISLLIFISLLWTLARVSSTDRLFSQRIEVLRTDIIAISGILSGIIIAYLTSKVLQIRQEKLTLFMEMNTLTQKLHKFRSIVNKLIQSNLWVNGLQKFVDVKYVGLTFFDVSSLSIPGSRRSDQARAFIQDHSYGDTALLYLELKSFLDGATFDSTIYSEFDQHIYYDTKTLREWISHECGNGLYYYFDHKHGVYGGDLNLNNVYVGDQEDILNLAFQIDRHRYSGSNFDNRLLSKLGTQAHGYIIPRLHEIQLYVEAGLPNIVKYLVFVLLMLILFGVLSPIIIQLYLLPGYFEILSISLLLSTGIYLMISFFAFLNKEVIL